MSQPQHEAVMRGTLQFLNNEEVNIVVSDGSLMVDIMPLVLFSPLLERVLVDVRDKGIPTVILPDFDMNKLKLLVLLLTKGIVFAELNCVYDLINLAHVLEIDISGSSCEAVNKDRKESTNSITTSTTISASTTSSLNRPTVLVKFIDRALENSSDEDDGSDTKDSDTSMMELDQSGNNVSNGMPLSQRPKRKVAKPNYKKMAAVDTEEEGTENETSHDATTNPSRSNGNVSVMETPRIVKLTNHMRRSQMAVEDSNRTAQLTQVTPGDSPVEVLASVPVLKRTKLQGRRGKKKARMSDDAKQNETVSSTSTKPVSVVPNINRSPVKDLHHSIRCRRSTSQPDYRTMLNIPNSGESESDSDGPIHECDKCPSIFDSLKGLLIHIKKEHSVADNVTEFACFECGEIFRVRKDLKEHIKVRHSLLKSNGDPYYRCNDCDKTFETWVQLKKHKKQQHMAASSIQGTDSD